MGAALVYSSEVVALSIHHLLWRYEYTRAWDEERADPGC